MRRLQCTALQTIAASLHRAEMEQEWATGLRNREKFILRV